MDNPLLPRLQALEAQGNLTSSQIKSLQTSIVPVRANLNTGSVYLASPVLIANASGSQPWTTVAGIVPAGAAEVILSGYFENFSSNVSHVHVYIRQNSTDPRFFTLADSVGGATGATGSFSVQARFPVNSDGSFQWFSDSGGSMGYDFSVIGYVW